MRVCFYSFVIPAAHLNNPLTFPVLLTQSTNREYQKKYKQFELFWDSRDLKVRSASNLAKM